MAGKNINNGVDEISGNQFESCMSHPLCVIDFFTEWCMPCLILAPVIEELADKFRGKIHFAKINVEENQELAQKFGIMSIPTLIVFKKGEIIEKITGSLPVEILEEKFKKHL